MQQVKQIRELEHVSSCHVVLEAFVRKDPAIRYFVSAQNQRLRIFPERDKTATLFQLKFGCIAGMDRFPWFTLWWHGHVARHCNSKMYLHQYDEANERLRKDAIFMISPHLHAPGYFSLSVTLKPHSEPLYVRHCSSDLRIDAGHSNPSHIFWDDCKFVIHHIKV